MLQAREDAVQGIVKEAHNKLGSVIGDKKAYRSLLTDLTVQARVCTVTKNDLTVQARGRVVAGERPHRAGTRPCVLQTVCVDCGRLR